MIITKVVDYIKDAVMLARLKFEIDELVQEMVSHLPKDLVSDKNTIYLDPAMGGGQFTKILEREFPDNLIVGYENNAMRIKYAVNKYKLKGQYKATDWLKDGTVQPDVIIGNPPFQRADNAAKRWTLWEEFVNKSLDESNHVAMIVPQSLTSPGATWNRIKKHCKVLNVNIKHHFDVGSSFCYFVVDQTREFDSTKIISKDGEFNIDVRDLPCLPNEINETSLNLLEKLVNRKSRKWNRGELHTSQKNKFDDNGIYEVMHTNAQTFRSNFEHTNKNKIRVAVSLSGYPKFRVIHNAYCSQAVFWTELETLDEAQQFVNECNAAEIQTIMSLFKWSGWNSKEIISML